jgi:hypothetical protein
MTPVREPLRTDYGLSESTRSRERTTWIELWGAIS